MAAARERFPSREGFGADLHLSKQANRMFDWFDPVALLPWKVQLACLVLAIITGALLFLWLG
ncbi:MAG TPA: hypothetical protein VGB70_02570 [Allosphingosinicella sp.]